MLWFMLVMVGLFAMMIFIRPFRGGRPFGWRPMFGRPLPGARFRRARRMWRRW